MKTAKFKLGQKVRANKDIYDVNFPKTNIRPKMLVARGTVGRVIKLASLSNKHVYRIEGWPKGFMNYYYFEKDLDTKIR